MYSTFKSLMSQRKFIEDAGRAIWAHWGLDASAPPEDRKVVQGELTEAMRHIRAETGKISNIMEAELQLLGHTQHKPRIPANTKRKACITAEQYKHLEGLHEQEVKSWHSRPHNDRLLVTLGMSNTNINEQTRTKLMTSCMHSWAQVEDTWDRVNAQTANP